MRLTRLTIRREQLDVMQALAEANFERRLADHLRAKYPDSRVELPDGDKFPVGELFDKKLIELVRAGVSKARSYGLTHESSIATFVALMVDVAPNFDEHRLCEVLLNDDEKGPDERMGDLLSVLTEKNWEAIRRDYQPSAWIVEERVDPGEHEPEPEAPPESIPTETFMSRTKRGRSTKKIDAVEQTPIVGASDAEINLDETIKIERQS